MYPIDLLKVSKAKVLRVLTSRADQIYRPACKS